MNENRYMLVYVAGEETYIGGVTVFTNNLYGILDPSWSNCKDLAELPSYHASTSHVWNSLQESSWILLQCGKGPDLHVDKLLN
jgi:hypothetical protein